MGERSLKESNESGKWELVDSRADLPVPRSLYDLLWLKIERLSSAERDLLIAASVCGSRFPREMLALALQKDPASLETTLEKLKQAQMLSVSDKEISFEHGSIREAAKRRLLQKEAKKIAEKIIEGLGAKIRRSEYRQLVTDIYQSAGRHAEVLQIRANELHRLLRAWRLEEVREKLVAMDRTDWTADEGAQRAKFLYLSARGRLADFENNIDAAYDCAEQALAISRALKDSPEIAIALGALARLAEIKQDWETAIKYSEEALEIETASGNLNGQALMLSTLARMAERKKDWNKAKTFSLKGLELNRAIKNLRGQAVFLDGLGRIAEREKDWDTAQSYYQEAFSLCDWSRGDPRVQQMNLAALGKLASRKREWMASIQYLSMALEIARAMNDRRGIPIRIMDIVRLAENAKEISFARSFAQLAADYGKKYGSQRDVKFALETLARLPSTDLPQQSGNPELVAHLQAALDATLRSARSLQEIRGGDRLANLASDLWCEPGSFLGLYLRQSSWTVFC